MLVLKLGGGSGMDMAACCDDIAALWQGGRRMVVLHGGADETSELGERLGHPARFVKSPNGMTSRYTDRDTLEILAMACAGRRNVTLVEALQQRGVNAVGLAGVDGAVLRGQRKATITAVEPHPSGEGERRIVLRDDHTGKVTHVNTHLLHLLLAGGYLPVLCPPAISEQHEAINIDGDRAAAAVAAALDAEDLVILSDVPGLLRDRFDHQTLVPLIPADTLEQAMTLAQGSMRKKLLGAREALDGGVGRVILGLGRGEAPVQRALTGQGTVLVPTEAPDVELPGAALRDRSRRALP
ncbi:MAG TPA: [LysW]-aminoadipate kinase [Chloroflexota bacterium]|nr:[LysW]-aminoadipate kinase [Chloroflexota bacterium]